MFAITNNRRTIGDHEKERDARTDDVIEDLAVGNEDTETVTGGLNSFSNGASTPGLIVINDKSPK